MSVRVVRKVQRSLYSFTLMDAQDGDHCCLCLKPADVDYEGFTYCTDDAAEKFTEDLFHAKIYAKTIGAHS